MHHVQIMYWTWHVPLSKCRVPSFIRESCLQLFMYVIYIHGILSKYLHFDVVQPSVSYNLPEHNTVQYLRSYWDVTTNSPACIWSLDPVNTALSNIRWTFVSWFMNFIQHLWTMFRKTPKWFTYPSTQEFAFM